MVFERPLLLLLLPAGFLLLWWLQRRSLAEGPRRIFLAIRCLIWALVVLALARPLWVRPNDRPAVIFLRDASASIESAAAGVEKSFLESLTKSPPGPVETIAFAADQSLSGAPAKKDATDLAGALALAAARLPAGSPGRIVLLSDGQANAGKDVEELLPELHARGVQVDVLPLPPSTLPDVAVTSVEAPPHLEEGETFTLEAELKSRTAVPAARLRLFQNNVLVAERTEALEKGATRVSFPRLRATGATGKYEVQVASPGDSVSANNSARTLALHESPGKVLLVSDPPEQAAALAGALRAAGQQVEIRSPSGFPKDSAELQNFSAVLFNSVPAESFSTAQLESLSSWVRDFGGGFVMLGGENSFGAGGYFRTPVADLLPVSMDRTLRDESPVVALLIILDRSGSMAAPVAGRTKIDLADEGASLALDVLQPKDLFGLFAVDTRVQDVVPLGPIADKQAALRKIAGITAGGGGIYIYTSLAEALPRLRQARAKIKHLILFSDAADAEEKTSLATGGSAVDLTTALVASGVTLSVVALGSDEDPDVGFLRDLALRGGGRFYLTADATSLPRLFAQETLRATQSSLKEEPFVVHAVAEADALKGIPWEQSPPLLGQNIATLKPGARDLLANETGQPILADWSFGAGHVAAFLSDANDRWASGWLGWSGYGKFWSQLVRQLARPGQRADLALGAVEERDGRLVVDLSAISLDGRFRNGLPVTVTFAAGEGSQTVPAEQISPGQYQAVFPRPADDQAMIAVRDSAGAPLSALWSRPSSHEYLPAEGGEALLRHLAGATGGMVNPTAVEVFRPAPRPVPTRVDFSSLALAGAALLWLVDVWLRRRQWRNRDGEVKITSSVA